MIVELRIIPVVDLLPAMKRLIAEHVPRDGETTRADVIRRMMRDRGERLLAMANQRLQTATIEALDTLGEVCGAIDALEVVATESETRSTQD